MVSESILNTCFWWFWTVLEYCVHCFLNLRSLCLEEEVISNEFLRKVRFNSWMYPKIWRRSKIWEIGITIVYFYYCRANSWRVISYSWFITFFTICLTSYSRKFLIKIFDISGKFIRRSIRERTGRRSVSKSETRKIWYQKDSKDESSDKVEFIFLHTCY
jgi:hypothetical protein